MRFSRASEHTFCPSFKKSQLGCHLLQQLNLDAIIIDIYLAVFGLVILESLTSSAPQIARREISYVGLGDPFFCLVTAPRKTVAFAFIEQLHQQHAVVLDYGDTPFPVLLSIYLLLPSRPYLLTYLVSSICVSRHLSASSALETSISCSHLPCQLSWKKTAG